MFPLRCLAAALHGLALAGLSGHVAAEGTSPARHPALAAAVFDAGRVAPVTTIRHEFVFTNAGLVTLSVTGIVSSCSCLKAGSGTRTVPPGGRGAVPLEWITAGFPGPQEETLTLQLDDPGQPVATLTVRGLVWLPIEARPAAVTLAATPGAEAAVTITNHLAGPVTLRPPVSSHRAFTAELRTNIPGRDYAVRIRTVPPAASGNVFGRVTLGTSAPEMSKVEVRVFIPAAAPVKAGAR